MCGSIPFSDFRMLTGGAYPGLALDLISRRKRNPAQVLKAKYAAPAIPSRQPAIATSVSIGGTEEVQISRTGRIPRPSRRTPWRLFSQDSCLGQGDTPGYHV